MSLIPDALAPFDALPDEARLWLLVLDRPAEASRLAPGLEEALGRWRHKGVQYRAAWTLLHGCILAIAEPTLAAQPSGCAIDGMLRTLHRVVEAAGLALADPQDVVVHPATGVQIIPRSELEGRIAEGSLDGATPVVDRALYTLGDLRQGRLERPLAATWIGRKYRVASPAV